MSEIITIAKAAHRAEAAPPAHIEKQALFQSKCPQFPHKTWPRQERLIRQLNQRGQETAWAKDML